MIIKIITICLLLALQGFANSRSPESAKAKEPIIPDSAAYLGQALPGETPVLFAPAILTALSAFAGAPTFSPDGSQCFVSVGAADYATPATLYHSEFTNGAWKPFSNAPFLADFASSCESVFSDAGHTLTFTGKKSVAGSTDFWTVDYSAHVWGTPVCMPAPINSGANEWRGSIMADGTRYFGSERDQPGIYQIFKAYLDANRKPVVEKLGLPINMNSYEGDPCIAADGHFLIFCSGRNGGSTDLFVSFSDGKGGWGTPIDLGPAFNTGNDEYGAYLSHDGKYLFFTRHTSQGDGIYWVAISAIEKLRTDTQVGVKGPYFGQPQIKGAYLGLTPPGEKPEVFAPGTVSLDSRLETYPAFSPDGKELYFSVVNAAWSEGKILWSRLKNGAWTKVEAAPFSAGRYIDWESSISPDGKRMFFASNRPPSSGMDIWMVERMPDTSWSAPVRLPDSVNSAAEDGSPCPMNNGTMYFKSLRSGGIGGSWLYRAIPKDGVYTQIESLGNIMKTTMGETEPYISPDEKFLIFISQTRKGGSGGWDLWICFRNTDGSWTPAITMGPEINTAADEYGPRVTPDGNYLFFTRETRGKAMDIYWVSASIIDSLRISASIE